MTKFNRGIIRKIKISIKPIQWLYLRYFFKNKIHGTFLGRGMSQTKLAIPLFEKILTPIDFKRIVEFGTDGGVLSHYFLLFCQERGAMFHTYDIEFNAGMAGITNNFHRIDIFLGEKEIGEIISREGITFVFCDNGDKPREFNTFAPYLKKGDIMAVHDWGTEINMGCIKETCQKYNLKLILIKECKKEKLIKVFQRI